MTALPEQVRHKGAVYIRAKGPMVSSLIAVIQASMALVAHLDDEHLDSPVLQGDEELLRHFTSYHEELKAAAGAIGSIAGAGEAR